MTVPRNLLWSALIIGILGFFFLLAEISARENDRDRDRSEREEASAANDEEAGLAPNQVQGPASIRDRL